jgi:excisionase family DNA binding protein
MKQATPSAAAGILAADTLLHGVGLTDEEYITVAQAALQARLTPRHIRWLLNRGIIPGIKPGRDWLVKPSAVMEYLREQRRPGRKPRKPGG